MKQRLILKFLTLLGNWIDDGKLHFLHKINPFIIGHWVAFLYIWSLEQRSTKNNKTILCLDRFVFQRDLRVLQQKGEYNYIKINSIILGKICSMYCPKWMQVQILFTKYINEPKNEAYLIKFKEFGRGFLEGFSKKIKIDGIVLAGINYYHDYAIQLGAKDLNIPLCALFYEHYTIYHFQYVNTHVCKDLNFKFYGSHIATFGTQTAEVFSKGEVIEKNKITITGAPRYDMWRDFKPNPEAQKDIILFSYPGTDYGSPINFLYVLHSFAKSSVKYTGDVKYIVKCKDLHHYTYVMGALGDISHRLEVKFDVAVEELLETARAVFSFNSLTAVESLLSNANVYVPYFADARLPDASLQMAPDRQKSNIPGLIFIKTPEDVEKFLEVEATRKVGVLAQKDRLDVFKKYFYFPDNSTSTKVFEKFLDKVISDHKGKE